MKTLWPIALLLLLPHLSCGVGESSDLDDTTSPTPSKEVSISGLKYYVNTTEGINETTQEFQSIKGGQRKPWTEASKPENLKKNRYDDLLAYDETRVKLEDSYEGQTSDYINANYITGTNHEKEYIATQGPLENTVNDFWAMVWQENANKIVMLSNLTEHGKSKVFKYWPEKEATYGSITVKLVKEEQIDAIQQVIRHFIMEKEGESRSVYHFHYTGWPDLGVPAETFEVLALMREIRVGKPDTTGPIILHCSAGVGRTGTVILMDSMIEKAKQEGFVNFPQKLEQMRLQRVDVVEKPEQYVFAHRAVSETFSPDHMEIYGWVDQLYMKGVMPSQEEVDF